MPTTALPSAAELRKLLSYDEHTGKLFWKERPEGRPQWNARFGEKEAFAPINSNGYKTGAIMGRNMYAHRVIWCIAHGEWPDTIDHINGDRSDNRLCNLRNVTKAENLRNQKLRFDNTSGQTGVYWCKRRGNWKAEIKNRGRTMHIGRYNCLTAASVARKRAEQDLGYHPNHGRNA